VITLVDIRLHYIVGVLVIGVRIFEYKLHWVQVKELVDLRWRLASLSERVSRRVTTDRETHGHV